MLHFVEDITRTEGTRTLHNIDGYTTRKTLVGACHDIGKYVKDIDQDEAHMLLSVKTEAEAKCLFVRATDYAKGDKIHYIFEMEEVPCATMYDEENDENIYDEGNYYFHILFYTENAA